MVDGKTELSCNLNEDMNVNSFLSAHGKKSYGCGLAVLFLSLAASFAIRVPGTALFAKAATFPTGDMGQGPDIEYAGVVKPSSDQSDSSGNDQKIYKYQKNSIPRTALNTVATGDHYNKLIDIEKELYDAIYSAVTGGHYIKYNVTATDAVKEANRYVFKTGQTVSLNTRYSNSIKNYYTRAAEACYFDHPDMIELYMCWPLEYGTIYDGSTYDYYFVFKSHYDESKYSTLDNQVKEALNKKVTELKAHSNVSTIDAVTELNVHDYYADLLTYDNTCANSQDYFNLSHTAWGALYAEKAVCDGYSAGYLMILEELGMDAMIIAGEGNGGGHAWNIVKLDNTWYEVDTTWAKPTGSSNIYYSFFNRTTDSYEAGISLRPNSTLITHKRVSDDAYCGFRMPKATGIFYTYEYLSGNYSKQITNYRHADVTGISLEQTEYQINVGESVTITPAIIPENASNSNYTVQSSDESIATVSENTVTGVSAGDALITFTTEDGGFTASCTVSVIGAKEGEECSVSNASYKVKADGTVSLSGITGNNIKTYSIPAAVIINNRSYDVTSIDSGAFKKNKKLTALKGGANLTTIGKNACLGCKKLKTVKLSSAQITSIDAKAFYGCSKLTKIELNGDCLKTVAVNAFKRTKSGVVIRVKAKNKSAYNKIVKKLKKSGCKNARFVRVK